MAFHTATNSALDPLIKSTKFVGGPEYLKQVVDIQNRRYEAYSGSDIQAVMYLPLLTQGRMKNLKRRNGKNYVEFAGLQTISISSTRSISPVRALGRSNPVHHTRGARTFAGTLVFATIETDPFLEVFDVAAAESLADASSNLFTDQLPPFSVVITAANETGGVAVQTINGITLVNYGTTYSVNDVYTETTYSYVASNVTNLIVDSRNNLVDTIRQNISANFKTVTQAISDDLDTAYQKMASLFGRTLSRRDLLQTNGLAPSSPNILGKHLQFGQ